MKGPNIPHSLHKGDREAVGYLLAQEKTAKDTQALAEAAATSTDLAALDTRVTALEHPVAANTTFVTADQAITASTAIAGITHGLTLTTSPNIRALLVCVTGELGYSAGELIGVPTNVCDFWNSGTTTHFSLGCTVSVDATKVYITYGSHPNVFSIENRSSGAYSTITTANWTLRVVVEA